MPKIVITGDFCPAHLNPQTFSKDSNKDAFSDFLDAINGKDIHITNLECPLTGSTRVIPKYGPALKAAPEMIEALKYTRVDVVCLANNHILDFGNQGLSDTINLCKKNGIMTVGAGKNLSEASEVLYVTIKNKKIALINITQHEFSIASENRPGANPLNIVQNYYSIIEARKHSSVVLVIVHGGNEEYSLPSERVMETYRFFADIGADAVISHHSHRVSGYEIYNGVPIFYGLGNFILDHPESMVPVKSYIGLILLLNINGTDQITFELKPFRQSVKGAGFKLLEGSDKIAVMKEIDQYSEAIRNRQILQHHWNNFIGESRHYYYTKIAGLGFIRRKLYRIPFLQKWIFPVRRKTVLYDLIKCEAHNDVISDLLLKDLYNE